MSDSGEDDPLAINKLAVSFDYLMYKIKDHIESLSEETYEAVNHKQNFIDNYIDQIQLDKTFEQSDTLIRKCDNLEMELYKLEKIEEFVGDFKNRIAILESEIRALNSD